MEQALQTAASALPAKFSANDFDAVASGAGFLPRIQLMTSNSEQCKSGAFPVNHFAHIVEKDLIDLGAEVDILPIAFRPKAIEFGDEVVSCYDVKSEMFAQIKEKAGTPDSGCMFGPEFLVFLPSRQEFAHLFMGNTSARREAKVIFAGLGKPMTLKAKKVEGKKYTWFTIKAITCTTPFDLPDSGEVAKQTQTFENPPATELEPGTRNTGDHAED